MAKPKINSDGRTITVRVPISIRKRGGRKVVLTPDGREDDPSNLRCRQIDNAMVKALARAFRWREMLENGTYSTIKEIADREKIAETYVGRVLRLNLLAPDIIEMILAGAHPPGIGLPVLMQRRFPTTWGDQRTSFGTQAAIGELRLRKPLLDPAQLRDRVDFASLFLRSKKICSEIAPRSTGGL